MFFLDADIWKQIPYLRHVRSRGIVQDDDAKDAGSGCSKGRDMWAIRLLATLEQ